MTAFDTDASTRHFSCATITLTSKDAEQSDAGRNEMPGHRNKKCP